MTASSDRLGGKPPVHQFSTSSRDEFAAETAVVTWRRCASISTALAFRQLPPFPSPALPPQGMPSDTATSARMGQLSMRSKIILTLLLTGLACLATGGIIGYQSGARR
jgi:hypothetical protein